ncbi:hypothetical protein ACWCYR_33180, partial [Streptomyces sp. NPDC001494]
MNDNEPLSEAAAVDPGSPGAGPPAVPGTPGAVEPSGPGGPLDPSGPGGPLDPSGLAGPLDPSGLAGLLPGAVVDPDLDPADAAVLGPGD